MDSRAPFPTWRECPHDGKTLACQDCLDEAATRQMAKTGAPGVDAGMAYYENLRGKLHFAHKAIASAKLAGAGPKLIAFLERLRDDVANTGD